jgi:hypothetical protein
MKYLALALLLAATTGMTATLGNSNISYDDAAKACPAALGTVTFAHNFARFHANGSNTEKVGDADSNGIVMGSFADPKSGKSAKVTVDQSKRTVSAKHMTVQDHGQVACISPD